MDAIASTLPPELFRKSITKPATFCLLSEERAELNCSTLLSLNSEILMYPTFPLITDEVMLCLVYSALVTVISRYSPCGSVPDESVPSATVFSLSAAASVGWAAR